MTTHPALHEPPFGSHDPADKEHYPHFVPVGWEETNRGLCPCGEVVKWDGTKWVPDRTYRVLVLTPREVEGLVKRYGEGHLPHAIEHQLTIQEGL